MLRAPMCPQSTQALPSHAVRCWVDLLNCSQLQWRLPADLAVGDACATAGSASTRARGVSRRHGCRTSR